MRTSYPFCVDYSLHPAFSSYPVVRGNYSSDVDAYIENLNQLIFSMETELVAKRINLVKAWEHVNTLLHPLIGKLLAQGTSHSTNFSAFMNQLYIELNRVVIDDLAYFERRNSYLPVINNAIEMNLRNSLAGKGYHQFQLTQLELASLRSHMSPYLKVLWDRHKDGERGRDRLSINQIDPDTTLLVRNLFEGYGFNKMVSDVRHEFSEACGFAIEISVDDADWWRSRYEDVGISESPFASYFHTDESRDVYKAIVYLDDVDSEKGPFSFIPSSYRSDRPRFQWAASRAILTALAALSADGLLKPRDQSRGLFTSAEARHLFSMLPTQLQLNSHFGFDVLDDSELSEQLKSSEVQLIAGAGHGIVFDGSRLVHRGGLVQKGARTALQIIFGVNKGNGVSLFNQLIDGKNRGSHGH